MRRILIIDDNQTLAGLYRVKFAAAGFTVDMAHDGPTGLEAARRAPPDVVLLDLMLPNMNGVEVLTAVRADPALSAIPVIVMSNSYTPERTELLWKAGATQVLTKANSGPNVLLDAIRAALAQK
jgi:DNA-binding response OmpR family regulator